MPALVAPKVTPFDGLPGSVRVLSCLLDVVVRPTLVCAFFDLERATPGAGSLRDAFPGVAAVVTRQREYAADGDTGTADSVLRSAGRAGHDPLPDAAPSLERGPIKTCFRLTSRLASPKLHIASQCLDRGDTRYPSACNRASKASVSSSSSTTGSPSPSWSPLGQYASAMASDSPVSGSVISTSIPGSA